MMAKWGKLENQVTNTFNRALARKGYLSLCSIVESQYYTPHPYRLENKRVLPQPCNIIKYRIEYQQKRKRRQAYAVSQKLTGNQHIL